MTTDAVVIGLDIGGTWIRVALADGGRVLATRATRWPDGLSPAEEVGHIADFAVALARESGKVEVVSAAGVSLAAMVDGDGVVVSWPNRTRWRGLSFKALLEERLGVPVAVEDDANAAALAEWQSGAGRGYRNLLVMTAGTGVGCGLILDGALFRGSRGWAGELGHQVMLPDGAECPCGHRGCLQTLASGRALERVAATRNLPDAAALVLAAEEGQAWAAGAIAACGGWLGLAAANVVNLLDLEAVIVGGGLCSLPAAWWDALGERFDANLLNRTERRVVLRKATLTEGAGLAGATSLARRLAGLTT
jgi:glucokinase